MPFLTSESQTKIWGKTGLHASTVRDKCLILDQEINPARLHAIQPKKKKKKPKQNKLMVMTEQAFLSLEARARLCACSRVAQSCTTPCKPTDFSPPGSAVPGILQETVLEWVAISFSRGSSTPRDQTLVSCIPGRFFTH